MKLQITSVGSSEFGRVEAKRLKQTKKETDDVDQLIAGLIHQLIQIENARRSA